MEADATNAFDIKKITIDGTNNKYQMKKVTKDKEQKEKEIKKRVVSEKWTFSEIYFKHEMQLELIKDIQSKNINEVAKIASQQINTKISSYKQQDIIKNRFDEAKFIKFEDVIDKMVNCELMCRYCKCEMFILYDISREMKQWSVDRVDNYVGHNNDNYYLACLECNLKKRRRTDEKFLFTKQLKLVKKDS
jgi:hypothetical protein